MMWWVSPSPAGSCTPGCGRCCDGPAGPGTGKLRVGPLDIDPIARRVWLRGEPLVLSKKEFALLRALAAQPTRLFTREELFRGVWGFRAMGVRLARSTRTRFAFAASSTPPGTGSWSTLGCQTY